MFNLDVINNKVSISNIPYLQYGYHTQSSHRLLWDSVKTAGAIHSKFETKPFGWWVSMYNRKQHMNKIWTWTFNIESFIFKTNDV